eukprot:Gb_31973 [translate_table: standard]
MMYFNCTILSVLQGVGNISKQAAETKLLLSDLLLRHKGFHNKFDPSQVELSPEEVQLLCVLLKTYMLHLNHSSSSVKQLRKDAFEPMFETLCVEGISPDDSAIIKPCVIVLEGLSSTLYDSLDATLQVSWAAKAYPKHWNLSKGFAHCAVFRRSRLRSSIYYEIQGRVTAAPPRIQSRAHDWDRITSFFTSSRRLPTLHVRGASSSSLQARSNLMSPGIGLPTPLNSSHSPGDALRLIIGNYTVIVNTVDSPFDAYED